MAQKTVIVQGVGTVLLAKRRGNRNLRLSINAAGQVRVGLPTWVPYATGIAFVRNRSSWVNQHLEANRLPTLRDGDYIGKLHRLRFIQGSTRGKLTTRVSATNIDVIIAGPLEDPAVQKAAQKASERVLKHQAEQLLPSRLDELARSYGYKYKEVRIRRLSSRWGSCSHNKVITLSYFLIQLPWPLIDYVIAHELVHTKHLNHSKEFWSAFSEILPEVRALQKQIRQYKPRVQPTDQLQSMA